jgi:hypothetical protein
MYLFFAMGLEIRQGWGVDRHFVFLKKAFDERILSLA